VGDTWHHHLLVFLRDSFRCTAKIRLPKRKPKPIRWYLKSGSLSHKLFRYQESRPHLQVWLTLYCVDMLLSVAVMVVLLCVTVLSTKIILGITCAIFYVMELYYFSTLYRYCISLKTTARYDVCQIEDDKLSFT
jgi:hypothetical protein